MMNCLAVIERTFYGQRSGITAARAIAHIEALEVENAALLQQMQEMVRMAAEKNRPAYDEQQRVIMELRDENAALKARGLVLSEDELAALERIELLMCKQLRILGEITELNEIERAGVISTMESQRADLRIMRNLLSRESQRADLRIMRNLLSRQGNLERAKR
jgi:hypothetical protein